jgi:hypothetical protein
MAFPGVYPSITSTLPERDFSRLPCTNTRLFSLAHFHRQHVFHGIYQLSSLDTGFRPCRHGAPIVRYTFNILDPRSHHPRW